ncbi:MAG: GNAT family N-acetyltransferase [Rhodocyclaceae bacterium]|nr:MAG: GNAT family N-acetyltransferase [Rhodocyclaceae bacterium]
MKIEVKPCENADVQRFAGDAKKEGVSLRATGATEWFLAVDGEAVVGCVALMRVGSAGRLKGAFVPPELRRRGIYRAMLEAVIAHGIEHGYRIFEGNAYHPAAPGTLAKLGFEHVGNNGKVPIYRRVVRE